MNEIATILSKSQMSGDDIQTVIKMIDQESANSVYRKCAEEFGFKIVEVEGKVISVAKELAEVFGYSSDSVSASFEAWNVRSSHLQLSGLTA